MATPMTVADSSSPSRPLYAILLRLAAVGAVAVNFLCVKLAGDRGVHIVETLFYRQLLSLPVAFIAVLAGPGIASLKTAHIGKHASRTAAGMTGMLLNFLALMLLPLAEATTINFSAPIFATILSVLFLGERPGLHRWLAVFLGFCGVLVIASPELSHLGGTTSIGVAVAIGGAIAIAVVSMLLRQIGRTEIATTTVFYFSALSLPFLALLMPFFGQWHDAETMLILCGIGVAGGIGQLLMTASLRWGPVSLVLTMDYTMLLWSTLFGWIFWSVWPGPTTWAGAVIIAASSIYIAWRERVKRSNASADAAGIAVN